MAIWFVPVNNAAAVLRVDLKVDRPMDITPVRYASCFDTDLSGDIRTKLI
ncbi:hypothetical protein ACUHMQ_08865 [Chitinimonas sp. PSY-7]